MLLPRNKPALHQCECDVGRPIAQGPAVGPRRIVRLRLDAAQAAVARLAPPQRSAHRRLIVGVIERDDRVELIVRIVHAVRQDDVAQPVGRFLGDPRHVGPLARLQLRHAALEGAAPQREGVVVLRQRLRNALSSALAWASFIGKPNGPSVSKWDFMKWDMVILRKCFFSRSVGGGCACRNDPHATLRRGELGEHHWV